MEYNRNTSSNNHYINEVDYGKVTFSCGIVKSVWWDILINPITIKLQRNSKGG